MECRACHHEHDPRVRCDHAKRLREGKKEKGYIRPVPEVASRLPEESKVDVAVRIGKTANRRTREAYNAYQREYMKRYRASKRAKVLGDDNETVGIKSVPE